MSKKPQAKRPKGRPSDAWQRALCDFLDFLETIPDAYCQTHWQGLCVALNSAGYRRYTVAACKQEPYPGDPPDVEIGALKIIESFLRADVFDADFDASARLSDQQERKLRGLQRKALRAVQERLRALTATLPPDEAGAAGPLNPTKKKVLSLCRRKAIPGKVIARKLELDPDHVRRVLSQLVKANLLKNGPDGYRTTRAT